MLALMNAQIFPGDGSVLENGNILIKEGKIANIGSFEIPASCETIDLNGQWLTPGLIDCHTHISLMTAKGTLPAVHELNESCDPVSPQLRAIDAFNPADEAIVLAREAGFTTCYTGPGSANVIGGTGFSFKLRGRTLKDMYIPGSEQMKFAIGENPKRFYGSQGKAPVTRMGSAALIRDMLYRAKEYADAKTAWQQTSENGGTAQKPAFDLQLEALIPAVTGRQRCRFHCHRADDIMTVIRLANEFNLDYTIEHCTEGYQLIDELREADTYCVVGPLLLPWLKMEQWGLRLDTPAVLEKAGIRVCLTADGGTDTRFLPIYAGVMIREGMSFDGCLSALTRYPAEVLRLEDRIGSLEPGKDADIAVFNGNPFANFSSCTMTLIDGEIVYRKEI